MPKISICIPCYEYNGKGVECLEFSFNKMFTQTFKDFDVVISDHSKDKEILHLCEKWQELLDIKYFKNEENRGNPASNTNNVINKATSNLLKLICQDDYFFDEYSLKIIADKWDDNYEWMATGYLHTYDRETYEKLHIPSLNPYLYTINSIGTPSCVVIKNKNPLLQFDENLSYCYDVEYYYRYLKTYGEPKLIPDVTVANYLWGNSISATISNETIRNENYYIMKKHGYIK